MTQQRVVGELTDAKVLWPLLEQGVDYFLDLLFLGHHRGGCHLLPLCLLSLGLSNTNKGITVKNEPNEHLFCINMDLTERYIPGVPSDISLVTHN